MRSYGIFNNPLLFCDCGLLLDQSRLSHLIGILKECAYTRMTALIYAHAECIIKSGHNYTPALPHHTFCRTKDDNAGVRRIAHWHANIMQCTVFVIKLAYVYAAKHIMCVVFTGYYQSNGPQRQQPRHVRHLIARICFGSCAHFIAWTKSTLAYLNRVLFAIMRQPHQHW